MKHLQRMNQFIYYYYDAFKRAQNVWSEQQPEGHKWDYYSFESDWEKNFTIKINSQTWSNGAKGWPGGMATQAFCNEDVVVFYSIKLNIAFVYICRFAYAVKTDEAFLKLLNSDSGNLPGVDFVTDKRYNLDIIEIGKRY